LPNMTAGALRFPIVFALVLGCAAITAVFAFGCGGAGGDTPIMPSGGIAGVWMGSITDFAIGRAALRIELTGEAGSTRGTWLVTMPASSATVGGTLTETVQGRVRDTTFFLDVGCPSPGAGSFTIQRAGSDLRGSYFVQCAGLTAGTIELSR
jgi:hypothetical protein